MWLNYFYPLSAKIRGATKWRIHESDARGKNSWREEGGKWKLQESRFKESDENAPGCYATCSENDTGVFIPSRKMDW